MKELYLNDETPATILHMALTKDTDGGGHLIWEPETIWLHLNRLYDIELSRINKDKILALIGALTTNQFYIYWEALEKIGKAFNSQMVTFLGTTPLTPEELTSAILEVKLNETDEEDIFTSENEAYAETVFRTNGVSTLPPYLEGLIKYKTYYNYDKDVEKQKQYRIKLWTDLRLSKIMQMAKDYFGADIKKEIITICPNFTLLA